MIQKKRIGITTLLLFALFLTGCLPAELDCGMALAYTGSNSYEYYDVGNDRNADFLHGKGAEVCIPSSVQPEEIDAAEKDYAFGLYDVSGHKMLQEYRLTDKIYPASNTKLLTTLIALKYCNLSEMVTVSYNASHLGVYGAVSCDLKEGDTIMLGDLLTAFLVCSGNDAGIAIAEHISGSVEAFSVLMNEEAKKLGAVDTHFVNPHGLHNKDHYTTAYDIYLIMNELIHYNTFLSIISMPSCEINYYDAKGNAVSKTFESTNLYFNGIYEVPEGIELIGGKTGTTNAAGCCLTLYFKNSEDKLFIAQVFHAPTYEGLYNKMTELMEETVDN